MSRQHQQFHFFIPKRTASAFHEKVELRMCSAGYLICPADFYIRLVYEQHNPFDKRSKDVYITSDNKNLIKCSANILCGCNGEAL